ncbi:hypothetical protein CONCODRAFT_17903 [Conidiobolus coronatus NRRL 28638]|uniref:Uncharacterized protein n=1 Tax=Conidiobolus coronatus (strain ATCC 28846 / CBS 209.66 / NRRL 28638) TaxID=796925 RepID=A0A137P4V4_CONC2|nr:hypothetical protein CONCODRAFT_17903 [Conidiobolus coronatus NRRL 28638]|eukprot:KXN70047.1 hypothetical protein CONCODRAFT_17903 [Conidiobolus coronatus NRRL 28638]
MNNTNKDILTCINSKGKWSQLFEIAYISDYITKSDRINVSMACKYYRYRLNPKIFNKLTLLKGGVMLHFNLKSRTEYKHKLQMLIKRLNLDLKGVRQYIQVLELCDGFSTEFSTELISLFPNIAVFKVYSLNYRYDLVNLINLLSNLQHLKGVELSTGYYAYPEEQNDKIIEFFKSLNSLKFLKSNYSIPLESPFLKIDQNFTKLNTLTILNDSLLANLQYCMPSLKRIELPGYKMNEELMTNFIKLNPQLKRMECKWHQIDFIQRIWSPYATETRKMSEFKTRPYYNLFLTILRQYNIKYIVMDYVSRGDLYINIIKVTWIEKNDIEVVSIYHTKYNEIDWTLCKGLNDVLVLKYSYFKFFEYDNRFNYRYDMFDWKFIFN